METRVYFKWMGAYWSCNNEELVDLLWKIEKSEPITMDNCRELKFKPRGHITTLNDAMHRYEGAAR